MSLSAFTIKTRIVVAMGLLSAGMVAVGFLGLFGMHHELGRLQSMYNQRVVLVGNLGDLRAAEFNGASLLGMIVMSESRAHTAGLDHIKSKARTHHAEAAELVGQFVTGQDTESGRAVARTVKAAHDAVHSTIDRIYSALAANQHDLATKLMIEDLSLKIADLDDAMDAAAAGEKKSGREALEAGEREVATGRTIVVAGIVVVLLLGVVVSMLLVQAIVSGLNSAVTVAESIAGGKLGQAIDTSRRDEVGTLLSSLRDMDGKLHQIVGSVIETSHAVSTTARELSQGNDDLSQRTQEQASALAGTTSSMEMMADTVKQNADNAREANQLASGARRQAERGRGVVDRAVAAMGDINAVSRKIADIIGVIDEIAFQTNLLALNAAVEAARAGEQGRGFAVVATEVRSLAQRSATAAKEIKELIGDSVGKVRTGSELVDESGRALREIMDSISRVSDIVAEIAAASEEQSSGIEEVKNAVTQMDGVTQRNAALVEQAASAAKSMEQQAHILVEEISYFSSTQGDMAQAVRPRPATKRAMMASLAPTRPMAVVDQPALRRHG